MAKTIKVISLLRKANTFFVNSPDSAKTDRIAVANFIANVLHETGNYAGFGYLRDYHDPLNDPTRVVYYIRHYLR